jgi:hypothetical protein
MAALTPDRRKYWLLALPLLAALLWAGLTHQPPKWQRALHEFRGDISTDPGPNRSMSSALRVRQSLLLHPQSKLTLAQSTLLVSLINNPVNELSQSEALDVLSLAQRANALSPMQAQKAEDATLLVLRSSPGAMVRLESARFLGHLGNTGSIPALTTLGRDSDPKVQSAARIALARVQK